MLNEWEMKMEIMQNEFENAERDDCNVMNKEFAI